MTEKWMTVHRDYKGERYWIGHSEWDIPGPGRLRTTQSRRSLYYNEAQARRWARRWKVEFPTAVDNGS